MLERRRFAETRLDGLRRAIMWEPRGHADMYGGIPGPPVEQGSDLSVLFLHNDGFSTMCGHGIIALVEVALVTGMFPCVEPETTLRIDTPAGTVEATAQVERGTVGSVRFRNVPSFPVALDQVVEVEGLGPVRYDLGFGGAFYAYTSAPDLGLSLHLDDAAPLVEVGRRLKQAVAATGAATHPIQPELGFLYGVVFTGPPHDPSHHSRSVCVFANGEVDRSPTGTGVSGRLAIEHARGALGRDQPITVESIVGSSFTGRIVGTTTVGDRTAVIPEIEGKASIWGRAELWLNPDDELGSGFLLR